MTDPLAEARRRELLLGADRLRTAYDEAMRVHERARVLAEEAYEERERLWHAWGEVLRRLDALD